MILLQSYHCTDIIMTSYQLASDSDDTGIKCPSPPLEQLVSKAWITPPQMLSVGKAVPLHPTRSFAHPPTPSKLRQHNVPASSPYSSTPSWVPKHQNESNQTLLLPEDLDRHFSPPRVPNKAKIATPPRIRHVRLSQGGRSP